MVKRYLNKIYIALIILFLYAPTMTLIVLSFNKTKSRSIWGGFTLDWYSELFKNDSIMTALYNTLLIALFSALIATIIGTIAALAIENMESIPKRILLNLTYIPITSPEIVIGISLMLFFILVKMDFGFLTILLGHIMFNIPYVVLNVLPKLKQMNKHSYEAALDLGATPFQGFFKVVWPEIVPGVLTGFMLAFTFSLDDFIITHFVKGPGIDTLSTKIYSEVRKGIKPEMYALSTLLFISIILIMFLINRPRKARKVREARTKGKRIVAFVLAITMMFGAFYFLKPNTDGDVLYVYNWGEYMEPQVLTLFEEETGIKIIYEEYDTNETMLPKIKSGAISYDLVFPSDYMVQRMVQEDLLAEINLDNIPNLKNIDPLFLNREYDPTNTYSLPYMWGTVGILYNTDMVEEEVDSWDILWNKKYADSILMQKSVRDAFCVALKKLGYSLNTTNEAELDEATKLLIEQKPLVQAYVVDQVRDKMIGNEAALAVIYSGEAIVTREANEALEYIVPKEGSNLWFDAMVIPKNAKHKENAEKFIDFLCRTDIGLLNVDYIGYSTPLSTTKDELDEELQNDPIAYPNDEILKNCEVYTYLEPEVDAMYNEKWKKVLGE